MSKYFSWISMLFIISCIYLFVSAPVSLQDGNVHSNEEANVSVAALFYTVDMINAKARMLYTKEIVIAGKKVGLKFDEDWMSEGVEAGPLPALFLRLLASKMQDRKSPLGLFLGSDKPIAKSNQFEGEMLDRIITMREDLKPQLFRVNDLDLEIGMYADIASAQGCVTCHNEHPDSTKTDWKLNDLMGATTWTYPSSLVSKSEMRNRITDVYISIEKSYEEYLRHAKKFSRPVLIDVNWPSSGQYTLPNKDVFMAAVYEATGAEVVRLGLVNIDGNNNKESGSGL